MRQRTGSRPNAKSMPDDTEATEPKSPPTAQVLTASAAHAAAVAAKVEHSASATQQSAAATQKAAAATLQSVDRNTQLAADRTVLAAERTYAAWVRTGLSSLASGVGARALLKGTLPGWFGELTGSGLVIFSAFCFIAAVWRQ